jgi:serine/threonine protein phosphatase 1
MKEKYIVVGDIHGCKKQLDEILRLTSSFEDHKYVFLGDYIDRGPDAEGVIQTIKKIDAIFLRGNHEEMLIKRYDHYDFEEKMHLLFQAGISNDSFEWIVNNTILKYESDNYLFVHAGLNIKKNIMEQNIEDLLWTRETGNYYDLTNQVVIHGHTIIVEPEQFGNRINVNTGCGSNGVLTALVLPEMIYLKSSVSSCTRNDWSKILKELEKELQELEEFGTLEEIE